MSPSGGDWQPLRMLRQLNMPNESWPGPNTASELPEMLTEREACAKLLEFTNSGVRLVAGESARMFGLCGSTASRVVRVFQRPFAPATASFSASIT